MTEDAFKARIRELEEELGGKDAEINAYLDRIGELEEIIMRLEALIPEEDEKKKSRKKKVRDSKLAIIVDEKNKQIRELKDKMGFLRKEKPTELEKNADFGPNCKHCGAKLAEGQTICHVCKKKV